MNGTSFADQTHLVNALKGHCRLRLVQLAVYTLPAHETDTIQQNWKIEDVEERFQGDKGKSRTIRYEILCKMPTTTYDVAATLKRNQVVVEGEVRDLFGPCFCNPKHSKNIIM